jgi:hypothetical protein
MKHGAVVHRFTQRLRKRRTGRLRQQQQVHAAATTRTATEDQIIVAARVEIDERRESAVENGLRSMHEFGF